MREKPILDHVLDTKHKALEINMDERIYGTFAEIGAGQEVARYFFQAGGASQTVAKTISAYDMTFSDSIYGKEESGRYVCESRLHKMLDKEFNLLKKRLYDKRSMDSVYFAFANTVSAINFFRTNEAHGWIGVRFQMFPRGQHSDVIMHVRMLDRENIHQQEALGIIGVNLLHACYFVRDRHKDFIKALMDNLTPERLEIDMIRVNGPAFKGVDNKLLSLQLVSHKMTNAVAFDGKGNVVQPSEFFYKKNILALRGSFKPPTLLNQDIISSAVSAFEKDLGEKKNETVVVAEITMNGPRNHKSSSGSCHLSPNDEEDFLDRVNLLNALGHNVLISNFQEYYKLSPYFSRFTKGKIGFIIGVRQLENFFQEKYYDFLPGGILEAFGILFRRPVATYIYPQKKLGKNKKVELMDSSKIEISPEFSYLFQHLRENKMIHDIAPINSKVFSIYSREVFKMIQQGNEEWEDMVPAEVAKIIKEKALFGYQGIPGQKKN